MINLDFSEESIKTLLEHNQVDVVIHGCNCFHKMVTPVAKVLNLETDNDVSFIDVNFSPYGDINNLGTWTNKTYSLYNHEVEIFNLYCRYTLPAPECNSTHCASVYSGLYDIISQVESGHTIALSTIGETSKDVAEFKSMLSNFVSDNEDDLPDVNIVVVSK